VLLVPRRVLLGVLLGEGATLDPIHLSPLGHDRMAAAIWEVVEPAYEVPPAVELVGWTWAEFQRSSRKFSR